MNDETNDELDDIEIPKLACEALREAQRKAMESGPVVIRQGDKLVRRDPDGAITVLKDLPPRKKVTKGIRVIRKVKPIGDGTPLEQERGESP